MRYINSCSDITPPKAEKPYSIKHPIYFAKESRQWEGKGVAFLDASRKGVCYGKIYLITEEQFRSIQQQEGAWYNGISVLGTEEGIPVKTITHAPRFEQENKPGMRYIDVIKEGIKDSYPNMPEAEIDAYLMGRYLQREDTELLSFLRVQEHGVTVQTISGGLQMSVTKVINCIDDLKERGFIRQDRINARTAVWASADAVYYTVKDKRDTIDICADFRTR